MNTHQQLYANQNRTGADIERDQEILSSGLSHQQPNYDGLVAEAVVDWSNVKSFIHTLLEEERSRIVRLIDKLIENDLHVGVDYQSGLYDIKALVEKEI